MTDLSRLHSEEDVRSLVVTQWLADHGISEADVSVEYSIDLLLGSKYAIAENGEPPQPYDGISKEPSRTTKRSKQSTSHSPFFRPRADLLVRTSGGTNPRANLLVVEVKAPGEDLDARARDQGIFYARALRNGNIAPFVVLTNGSNTRIYDSITRKEISGTKLPSDPRIAEAVFLASGEDLAYRAEALELFLSLSPTNLASFCRTQVSFRMELLRSNDPTSGRKYIPSLYVERTKPKKELNKLLDDEKRAVVLLVGRPQVGKTNFICREVEDRINRGEPCLFYPAIGMKNGLLEEMAEDFAWISKDSSYGVQTLLTRLTRVLSRTGQKMVIFIDGWNEAEAELARVIDLESRRLKCPNIQLVISMTNVAADRLLRDGAGNPSNVANSAQLNEQAISRIEVNPEQIIKDWSVVSISKYTSDEVDKAYEKYKTVYDVEVPDSHRRVNDPFPLGVAMRLASGGRLPDELDEPDLLDQIIHSKARRAGDLNDLPVRSMLSCLASEMASHGAPVPQHRAMELWGIPLAGRIPKGAFEAALLAKTIGRSKEPAIEFYYGRERDFVLAIWGKDWHEKIHTRVDGQVSYFAVSKHSYVEVEALRWFFRQKKHLELLRSTGGNIITFADAYTREILLTSLYDLVSIGGSLSPDWFDYVMGLATNDPEPMVRVQAVRTLAVLGKQPVEFARLMGDEETLEKMVIGLLEVEEEHPYDADPIGYFIFDAFETLNDGASVLDEVEGASVISDLLVSLLEHDSTSVRRGAAKASAYIDWFAFLLALEHLIRSGKLQLKDKRARDYIEGIEIAAKGAWKHYEGGSLYCDTDSYMSILKDDPDLCLDEYNNMLYTLKPIFALYRSSDSITRLIDLLVALQPKSLTIDDGCVGPSYPSRDNLTYELPFDGSEE